MELIEQEVAEEVDDMEDLIERAKKQGRIEADQTIIDAETKN